MGNKITINEASLIVQKRGFTLLSKEYKNFITPLSIQHSCGHIFQRSLRDIKRGKGACPSCSTYTGIQLKFIQMKEFVSKETQGEYQIINKDKDYSNVRISKLNLIHKTCGHQFKITFSNFKLGRRCPYCAAKSQESNAIQLLKRLLEQVKIKFEEEKTFDDCINCFSGAKLRYDIFIPELNLAIEIDGEQHFIPVSRFGGEKNLKDTKYRDFLKNKYAFETGLNLLRISLYDEEKKTRKNYTKVKREIFELLLHIVKIRNELSLSV